MENNSPFSDDYEISKDNETSGMKKTQDKSIIEMEDDIKERVETDYKPEKPKRKIIRAKII